jgi:hypothetical protein
MKRHYNRTYFQEINTPEKAYWLGFIAADGYVRRKPDHSVSIGLKESDKNHLLSFANAVDYDGKLIRGKKNKSWRINLYGKQIVEDLCRAGVTPDKTTDLKPWAGPAELMPAYWLGFFDGDGCITSTIKKNNYKQWGISLIGTQAMCDGFIKFISISNKPCRYQRSGLDVILWNSIGPAKKIASRLYRFEFGLSRKKELSQKLLAQSTRVNRIQEIATSTLVSSKRTHGSWENVANALGVSRNGLYKHVRKIGILKV